jgi:hypothetical protein
MDIHKVCIHGTTPPHRQGAYMITTSIEEVAHLGLISPSPLAFLLCHPHRTFTSLSPDLS